MVEICIDSKHIPSVTHNTHTNAEQITMQSKSLVQNKSIDQYNQSSHQQQFLFMHGRLEWQRQLHTNLALNHLHRFV